MLIRIKFFLILFILSSHLSIASENPIHVKVGGYNFAPFIENEGKEGFVKDLLAKLNKSQDKYYFDFVLTSANRRYRDFKLQKFDVILFEDESWSWKKKKINYAKTVILASGYDLAVSMKEGNRDQTFFNSFDDKKVKVVLGYHYKVNDFKADHGRSYEDNLEDLLSKKIDITFLNNFILKKMMNKNKDLKEKLLVSQKKDNSFVLRGIIHPSSPIKASELEKLGLNKILISDN